MTSPLSNNDDPLFESLQNHQTVDPFSIADVNVGPNKKKNKCPCIGFLQCWTSNLRLRYFIAMVILLLAGLMYQLKIDSQLTNSSKDSQAIKTAGQLHMLIQSISKDAGRIEETYNAQQMGMLNQSIDHSAQTAKQIRIKLGILTTFIAQNHHSKSGKNDLQSATQVFETDIESYLNSIQLLCQLTALQSKQDVASQYNHLLTLEDTIQYSLNNLSNLLSAHASNSIQATRSTGWMMYALLIGVGLATIILVIEPGVRANRRALNHAKQMAHQAKKSEHLYSIHNEATNRASIVLVTDLNGTITHANDAFCEISGYTREEFIGQNCSIVNSGHHSKEFFKDMYRTIGEGNLWHGEICNRKKDGSLYWIDTAIVPLRDQNGDICQYYSLRFDITRQKEAENELRTILNALPSMVIYKDEDNIIRRVNESAAQWIGQHAEEIEQHNAQEFFNEAGSLSSYEDDLEVLANGTPKMGIVESYTNAAGRELTIRIDKIPLLDSSGFFTRLVTIATDITQTIEMEQRFSLAIESNKAGVWDWDTRNARIHVNDRYLEMLGDTTSQSPISAQYLHDRLHDEDRDRIFNQIQHAHFSLNAPYNAEYRLLHNDGSYRWIQCTGKITKINPDGTIKRMIGQHLDIDSSKRLGLAIRSALELPSKETEKETLQNLSQALAKSTRASFACVTRIIEKDGQQWGRVIAGINNGQPIDSFEYPLQDTPCQRVVDLGYCHFPDHITLEFPDDEMLKTENIQGYAGSTLVNSSGQTIGLLTIMARDPLNPPFDPRTALKLFGARALVELENNDTKDELRKSAQLAEDLNRSKSEFLANMSHEIRTPMTAILGYTDILEDEHNPDFSTQDRIDAINTIRKNGEHLLAIINDILDISKIEAGKMTVELIEIQPLDIIQQVESLMGARARGKGLDLNIEFKSDIPKTITSDPTRLRQVLLNLLGNAIKFTEDGSITIRLSLTNDDHPMLCIELIDTGIGMTQDQCNTIFDAFTQADGSTTRKFGGSGLGLNISVSLATMLGGHITVQSELGKGSCFRLTIDPGNLDGVPLIGQDRYRISHDDSTPVESKTIDTKPLNQTKILLVEDGPDNQRLISHHLRKAGATVDIAENGRIGVDAVLDPSTPDYQLIIMDMQMPVLDGYEASTELRNHDITIPIIALTAHAMESDRQKCLDAGCSAYQTKPIDKVALIGECVNQIQQAQRLNPPQQDAA